MSFFFFQAEDGIRDVAVTGVQTCALPISIQIDRADNTLRVPAAAVRFMPTEQVLKEFPAVTSGTAGTAGISGTGAKRPAVWQLVDGRLHRIPVRVGVSDGTQIAIASDRLTEGASIVTGVARSEAAAEATPAAGGSPLVPQMRRRPGNAGR